MRSSQKLIDEKAVKNLLQHSNKRDKKFLNCDKSVINIVIIE